jgi:hypothetical protein
MRLVHLGLMFAAISFLLPWPSFAQGSGKQGACRQESMEACVKRQMAIRDPVSGVRIQRGDAERFCSRRAGRC